MHRAYLAVIAIVALAVSASYASCAVVHGTAYEWSTFEALENVIVEVNSTPPQFLVASSGNYSFDLPEGKYTIRAEYYQNNVLEYCAEENITILTDGEFVLDLLMFPPIEEEFLYEEINISEELYDYEEPNETGSGGVSPVFLYAITILFIIIAGYAVFLRKKNNSGKPGSERGVGVDVEVGDVGYNIPDDVSEPPLPPELQEPPESAKPSELPSDLQEVLSIVRGSGGRITQRDLRAQLSCSEAKVSLMVTDLTDRGLVKKVKKGRGNVIILTDM